MLQYQEGYQIQVHRTITYPLVQIKWIDCLWPILNEIAVYFNVYKQIYDWYTISSKLCNLKRVVCISDLIYGFSCLTIHRSISAHYEAIWKIELSRYRNYRQQHFKNKREVEREREEKRTFHEYLIGTRGSQSKFKENSIRWCKNDVWQNICTCNCQLNCEKVDWIDCVWANKWVSGGYSIRHIWMCVRGEQTEPHENLNRKA